MEEKAKPAKMCYEHIGGKLGMLLADAFIAKGWIARQSAADKHFFITPEGEKELAKLGIDVAQIKEEAV